MTRPSDKLATLVEGDLKAPFSIATTLRCREGATPSPEFFHFTLDKYLIMLSVKHFQLMSGLVGWLFRFYGISTFVGYSMPNPFLYK